MKKLPLLVFAGMGALTCSAQSLDPVVIGSSGGSYDNGNSTLSWTIGEVVTPTIGNADYTLTQGFHQTKFTIVAVEELHSTTVDVRVYPNPTVDQFEISILSDNSNDSFQYELHDQNGRAVRKGNIINNKSLIELNGLANSIYFLKVWSDQGNYHKIYQVLKIK